jgi:hypothetical protein
MSFYEDMAGVAYELLGEFHQGEVLLKRVTPGTPDPDQPWIPVEPSGQSWPLKAAVKRLHQRYENGVMIVETGDMVTFAVPVVRPLVTDLIVIDGEERAITNLTAIPPAGTAAVWKAWCKA